jgi:predicted Fe-S protein YdhL (DUF1289 family)
MNDHETPVQSPCVRNCCLDEHDVCVGCGRTLQEIIAWNDAGEAQRRQILARAKRRQEARQARFRSPGRSDS